MSGKGKEPPKWIVLILMSLALFIMFIDTTMMNVSISALVRDLDTTVTGVQGAITLYALVMASTMMVGAKLADVWGTKKVFFNGLVIYTVGTLMASLAPNLAFLILGWSILEGIGAAMMMPATVTYLTKAYTGKDRVLAFGVWGGVGGAAAAFGPIIGGFFTTYYTWRLGFFMEAIIAGVIFAFMKDLKDYRPERLLKLDVGGAVLVALGLFLLTLSVLLIDPLGESPVFVLMALSIVVLWYFAHYEKKKAARGEDVLMDVKIFRHRGFTVANIVSIFFQLALAGIMFTVPIFVQTTLHYNAMDTGMVLLPLSIMMFIFSMLGGKFQKFMSPKRVIQLGIIITLIGIYSLVRVFVPGVRGDDFRLGMALFGTGFGLIFSQITNLAMSDVDERQQADASGIFNSQKQLGLSLGTAMVGAMLILGMISGLAVGLQDHGYDVTKDDVSDWINGFVPIPDEVQNISEEEAAEIQENANIHAMKVTLESMMVVLVIAAILSMWLPNVTGNDTDTADAGKGGAPESEEKKPQKRKKQGK